MYTSETKQGRMYLPRTLFEDRGAVHEGRSIPNDLKESLKLFLRKRASILMASPELDRKTYSDHPQPHQLCDRERAEDVCVSHFFDEIGWPHKWTLAGSQPSGDSPEYRAMLQLNELHQSLRNTDKDMAEVIKSLSDELYWSSSLLIWLRVRAPKNKYGICVEDIEYKRLQNRLPEHIAEFITVSHNALIDVLAWLDKDLEKREADAQEARLLFRRQKECLDSERRLQEREKRHKKAVAKAKAALAATANAQKIESSKVMEEAQQLMAAANQRMAEAMIMAQLATRQP